MPSNTKNIFLLIYTIFFVIISLDILNHKFETIDFRVYYDAANSLKNHQTIYRVDGNTSHYVFKYSPFFAFLFIPFSLLPYWVSQGIYFIMVAGLYSIAWIMLSRLFTIKSLVLIGLIQLIFIKHIQKEIHLGQINLVVFSLCIIALDWYNKNKQIMANSAITFAIIIKPIALIFFPLFAYCKKPQRIFQILLSIGILVFLVYLIYYFPNNLSLKNDILAWFHELSNELIYKNNFDIDNCRLNATLIRWFGLSSMMASIFSTTIILLLYLYILLRFSAPINYFLILPLAVMLASTSNNFYIFSIPIFIYFYSKFNSLSIYFKSILILSSILQGGNLYELWGRKGVDTIDYYNPYIISILLLYILILIEDNQWMALRKWFKLKKSISNFKKIVF